MTQNNNAPAEEQQGAENLTKDTNFVGNTQLTEKLISNHLFADIEEDIARNVNRLESELQAGFFRVREGNVRMADAHAMPIPRNLYMSVVYEHEITLLFADTGVGKTIFAVQIAVAISKTGETVIYIDLELSDKQFEKRYSQNFENPYIFPENLHFADFSDSFSIPEGSNYDNEFIKSLLALIEDTGAKIIIIDNMTKLVSSDTDKAQTAKPLMDKLKEIQRRHGLTMLLLEHTRKTDAFKPISLNDLQGSKMKVNFADSVMAIARSSQGHDRRYLMQLKCRSSEVIYHSENVAEFEIVEKNSFLQFEHTGFGSEYEHLKLPDENTLLERNAKILGLKAQGLSNVEIGKQFGISESNVRKILSKADNN